MRRIFKLCLPIALLAHAAAAMAVAVQVAIDTHALPAAGFVVAFDLVDGGLPANTVVLTQLATDGSFATATFTGDAAASANAMTLGDAQFFNEILLPLASATELSFDIDMSLAAPAPGSLPDAFSLFSRSQHAATDSHDDGSDRCPVTAHDPERRQPTRPLDHVRRLRRRVRGGVDGDAIDIRRA